MPELKPSHEAMMTLGQAQQLLASRGVPARLHGDADVRVMRVHTDTRTLQTGDLFVALKGERFDAHAFLAQAKAQGASALVAQQGFDAAGLPGLEVQDTLQALGELAAAWRAQFTLPLIAVTGSNGKTTVTQMIASILREAVGEHAFYTLGNFNNDIGVPLTLLRLRAHHRLAVVELGMNHPGEIAHLSALAQPTIALVNNAQREHQEFMVSVEAVARENGSVLAALPEDGVAVFPFADAFTPLWQSLKTSRLALTFASKASASVHGQAQWHEDHWHLALHIQQAPALTCDLHIAGQHNVNNALAAAACAHAAGVAAEKIAAGLSRFEPVKGRSQVQRLMWHNHPLTLIDDTYNANPDSVRAAIDVLAHMPGKSWLVLGDMGEVGDQGPAFHREVGAYARSQHIAQLWSSGALALYSASAFGAGQHFDQVEDLSQALDRSLHQAARTGQDFPAQILVKGSRFMKMERVVQSLNSQTASRGVTC